MLLLHFEGSASLVGNIALVLESSAKKNYKHNITFKFEEQQ